MVIFHSLSGRARPVLRARGLRHTEAVFGLLQNARVDESYVSRLLPNLPAGDSELYSHPSLDEFRNEFDALDQPPGAGAGGDARHQADSLPGPVIWPNYF